MPPYTTQGHIFSCIHRTILRELNSFHGKKYENVGMYYKEIYGWFLPFADAIELLKQKNITSFNGYLQAVPYTGLIQLCFDNHVNSDDYRDYLKHKTNSNRYALFKMENDLNTITRAATYLNDNYIDILTSREQFDFNTRQARAEEAAEAIVEKVLCAIKTIDKQKFIRKDLVDHIQTYFDAHDLTGFEKWAILIIYAQNSQLPIAINKDRLPAPNIYLASKEEIEKMSRLEYRSSNASRIVLINYAGTSFIASFSITDEVNNDWTAFMYNLMHRGTQIEIVLTDPNSEAARDAEKYKMRPYTLNTELNQIIQTNISSLEISIRNNRWKNVNYYLTDIALPCAYLKSEFIDDRDKDNIKVDIYLPSFAEYVRNEKGNLCATPKEQCDNELRQSFIIYRKDNEKLYNIFSNNIEQILKHAKGRCNDKNES